MLQVIITHHTWLSLKQMCTVTSNQETTALRRGVYRSLANGCNVKTWQEEKLWHRAIHRASLDCTLTNPITRLFYTSININVCSLSLPLDDVRLHFVPHKHRSVVNFDFHRNICWKKSHKAYWRRGPLSERSIDHTYWQRLSQIGNTTFH